MVRPAPTACLYRQTAHNSHINSTAGPTPQVISTALTEWRAPGGRNYRTVTVCSNPMHRTGLGHHALRVKACDWGHQHGIASYVTKFESQSFRHHSKSGLAFAQRESCWRSQRELVSRQQSARKLLAQSASASKSNSRGGSNFGDLF